jgi:prevent-host-death family protein
MERIDLKKGVLPISAAQRNFSHIIDTARTEETDTIITVNGTPASVIVGVGYYQDTLLRGLDAALRDPNLTEEEKAHLRELKLIK